MEDHIIYLNRRSWRVYTDVKKSRSHISKQNNLSSNNLYLPNNPSNNLYLPNLSKINIHIALVLLLLNLSKDKYSYSTSLAIVKFEQVNTGWVISSRTHCPTFSPPQISDIPQAGFEPAHIHVFIYKQLIFSTQPQCCLSFS